MGMNHLGRRKSTMSEITEEKTETTPEINLEIVKQFLASDEGAKKWVQSESDARVQQALNTYKEKTLPKLVDDRVEIEYQKKHPDESPETKALRELKSEIEKTKQEVKRERLNNYALKLGTDKKLPTELLLKLVGEDEITTQTNITGFEQIYQNSIKTAMEERLKGTGKQTPVPGSDNPSGLTPEMIIKMTPEERRKYDPQILENVMKLHYGK